LNRRSENQPGRSGSGTLFIAIGSDECASGAPDSQDDRATKYGKPDAKKGPETPFLPTFSVFRLC
jgi:hypothetical protein